MGKHRVFTTASEAKYWLEHSQGFNPRVSILKGFTFKEIIWGLVGSGRGVSITEAFAGFGTSKRES